MLGEGLKEGEKERGKVEVPFQFVGGEDGLRFQGGILRSRTIFDLGYY